MARLVPPRCARSLLAGLPALALLACGSGDEVTGPVGPQGGAGGTTTSTSTTTTTGGDPSVDDDGDGYSEIQHDCDDTAADVHPGADEACADGIDNNCNGAIDDAEPDQDGDGYGPCLGDCDDDDAAVSPSAPEVADDGLDNNCDGTTDADFDADGFRQEDGDCDDADALVNPGAEERCFDAVDNDCNGYADDAEPDQDGDGTGPCSGDCDDADPDVGPSEPEIGGDGIDNDCDYLIDADVDGDGWTSENGDCDDTDAEANPAAIEQCEDQVDNDCDTVVDTDCIDPCKVSDDMNAVGECDEEAPPDSFEPNVQWTWTGPNGEAFSIVAPLVANLTDDDANGEIDLCDVPDVVVVASTSSGFPNLTGHVYVLDGATGGLHVRFNDPVDHTVTPAIGDVDGDGLPEIVTGQVGGRLMIFEHDGTLKLVTAAAVWNTGTSGSGIYSSAVALGDVDNDGDVEIASANWLADHQGQLLFTAPQPSGNWSASALADLDGDDDLELVLGHAAYHHDGSQYYLNAAVSPGYPQIANLDGDALPEVLVTNANGITLLEHDGATKYTNLRPTGDSAGGTTWLRPATVHDFDGDGTAEYALSSANHYTVYEPDGTITWTATVSDQSGIAAGTAFDFLGDGVAEAMYADEHTMFIFDGAGQPLLQVPRTSGTLSEYPVVADVDNDGSAEIVVVSNSLGGQPASPTVQVIRDVEDRWIQARRIWNQHTYHVTNVREDATIPQVEVHSWEVLNTYRTNAQIEGGGVCVPVLH